MEFQMSRDQKAVV